MKYTGENDTLKGSKALFKTAYENSQLQITVTFRVNFKCYALLTRNFLICISYMMLSIEGEEATA